MSIGHQVAQKYYPLKLVFTVHGFISIFDRLLSQIITLNGQKIQVLIT